MREEVDIQKELRKETDMTNRKYEYQIKELQQFIEYLHQELNGSKYENLTVREITLEYEKINTEIHRITAENQELKNQLEIPCNKCSDRDEKIKELGNSLIELRREAERTNKKTQEIENECEKLREEAEIIGKENSTLKSVVENYGMLKQELERTGSAFEINKKSIESSIKSKFKRKYKAKEERLKEEINGTIEEIQETIRQNSLEHTKTKKENAALQYNIKDLEAQAKEKNEFLEQLSKKIQDEDIINQFLKEKLSITENSLKTEIQKSIDLSKKFDCIQSSHKSLISPLNHKISEKSAQIASLSKQLSDLEKKHSQTVQDSQERIALLRNKLKKQKEFHLTETLQLKAINENLESRIEGQTSTNKNLEDKLESTIKDLKKVTIEKQALENSINQLEISVKHLDIQQTRHSLEELNTLRKKISQESSEKQNAQARSKELEKELIMVQQKLNYDSMFFKVEITRKDTELLKLQAYLESQIKEKEAETAIFIEELKIELVGVLDELVINDKSLSCCETLDQIIQSLN